MMRLLRTDFARLFKSKIFYLGLVFMFGFANMIVWNRWYEIQKIANFPYTNIDDILFVGSVYIGIVIAAFVGLFVGTDYRNGTIRNKLNIGHSRIAIYLSNLVVCMSASMMIHLAWLVAIIGEGIPLIGPLHASAGTVTLLILISMLAVCASSAIFLLFAMLISSKSAASVTVLVLSFLLLMSTDPIVNKLSEPEYATSYVYVMDAEGNVHREVREDETVKNPRYLSGAPRKIFEFLYDALPGCQLFRINGDSEGLYQLSAKDVRFPLYSLLVIAVTTADGIVIFRRKDLK